ncbi:MAG: hypothetical protein ACM3TN_06320 [Alphaproteobacteria bacterium]
MIDAKSKENQGVGSDNSGIRDAIISLGFSSAGSAIRRAPVSTQTRKGIQSMENQKNPKSVKAGKKGIRKIRKKAGDERLSEIATKAAAKRKQHQKSKLLIKRLARKAREEVVQGPFRTKRQKRKKK